METVYCKFLSCHVTAFVSCFLWNERVIFLFLDFLTNSSDNAESDFIQDEPPNEKLDISTLNYQQGIIQYIMLIYILFLLTTGFLREILENTWI